MLLLREFVQSVLREASVEIDYDGAGFIVVKDFDGEWKVLGLKDTESSDQFDFPKGRADPGEDDPKVTAYREAEEEASLKKSALKLRWGDEPLIIDGHLLLYLAEIDNEPEIQPNPKTGKIEHSGIEWLSFKDMSKQALYYLRPAVTWAHNKIQNN